MENIFNDCDYCSLTAICSLYKANIAGLSGERIASISNCRYRQIKTSNVSPPPLLDPIPRIRDVGDIIKASEEIARLQKDEPEKKRLRCCKCEKLVTEEEAIIDALTSYVFCEDCY